MSDERHFVYTDGVMDLSTADGIAAKEAAEAAAELSGQKAGEAVDAAGRSEAAAAEVATITGPLYATIAEGIAGTAVGAQFRVASSDPNVSSYRYRHDAGGVATLVETVPAASVLGEKANQADLASEAAARRQADDEILSGLAQTYPKAGAGWPLAVDDDGKVAVWIDSTGALSAAKVSDQFIDKVAASIPSDLEERPATNPPFALTFTDTSGDERAIMVVTAQGELKMFGTAASADKLNGLELPIATSGKGLRTAKTAAAKALSGDGKFKVLFTGDSWTEIRPSLMDPMVALLRARYGTSGTGWVSAFVSSPENGILDGTMTRSAGWSMVEFQSPNVGQVPSLDGVTAVTSATGQTIDINGILFKTLRVYYIDTAGSFTVAIDGGAPVAVTGANTGTIKSTVLTAATDGAHNVRMLTTGGEVRFAGCYASSDKVGVEVSKAGNGYSSSLDWGPHAPAFADRIAEIQPDVIVFILGTNDGDGAGLPVATFRQAVFDIASAVAATSPKTSIVFTAPPPNTGMSSRVKVEGYRDAMFDMAELFDRVDVMNWHDFMPSNSSWRNDDFNQSLLGNHLTLAGGRQGAELLMKHFLG